MTIHGKFVTMLDDDVSGPSYPEHWPIVFVDDTFEGASARTQFGDVSQTEPRSAYDAIKIDSRDLTYARTGGRMPCGIYVFRSKA